MRRLRRAVQAQWSAEVARRELDQPHPLHLQWRPAPPECRSATAAGWPLTGEFPDDPSDCRPPATALAEAFAAHPARRLVILAEPGAGKTTLAVLFVLAALAASAPDSPVPVLVPVAGWNPEEPIDEWLADRLFTDYPDAFRRRKDVRRALVQHRVMPVLDGLDEMPESRRHQALQQIDATVGIGPRLVLTCRSAEFREAVDRAGVLSRAAVITIDPVRPTDIVRYLTQREAVGSRRWEPVIAALRAEPDGPLAAALSTPLMVSLCRQVFRGSATTPELLTTLPSRATIEHHLLRRFLPSIYPDAAELARAERTLTFLARHLSHRLNTTTLAWWQIPRAVPSWVLASLCGFLGGLRPFCICVGALISERIHAMAAEAGLKIADLPGNWLPIVVVVAANTRRAQASVPPRGLPRTLATLLVRALRDTGTVMLIAGVSRLIALHMVPGPLTGSSAGPGLSPARQLLTGILHPRTVAYTIAAALVMSLASGAMTMGRAGRPRPFAAQRGPLLPALMHGLAVGLLAGLVCYCFAIAWSGGWERHHIAAVVTFTGALTIGMGTPIGLTRWLQTPADGHEPASPGSVLRADRRATLATASIISAAVVAAAIYVGLTAKFLLEFSIDVRELLVAAAWLPLAILPVAAWASGSSWLTFVVARTLLALTGRHPWRLMRFLEDAHRRGVLRQTGATYQFRHARLQDELALRPPGAPRKRPIRALGSSFEHVRSLAIFLLGIAAFHFGFLDF